MSRVTGDWRLDNEVNRLNVDGRMIYFYELFVRPHAADLKRVVVAADVEATGLGFFLQQTGGVSDQQHHELNLSRGPDAVAATIAGAAATWFARLLAAEEAVEAAPMASKAEREAFVFRFSQLVELEALRRYRWAPEQKTCAQVLHRQRFFKLSEARAEIAASILNEALPPFCREAFATWNPFMRRGDFVLYSPFDTLRRLAYDLPQRIRFDASFADRVSGAGGLDLDLTSQSDLDATDAAKAPPRGQLIAIEGIDGAGKTTIRYALYEALWADRQPSFIVGQRGWLDPVDTRTIVDFREQRADHDPEIVRAARFRDKVSLITRSVAPALRTHHVIADRYVISDAVYEEALLGVPAEVTLDRHRSGGTRSPDLTIFLDPDPMVALGRVGRRTRDLQVHENAEDLRRISNVYRRVFDDPQYAPPSQLLRFSRELPENPAQAAALVVEKVRERLAI